MESVARQPSPPRDRSGYLALDTIAAISTAVGGALSVVRISGPEAFAVLVRLTQREKDRSSEERKLMRARLHDEHGAELDDAMFVRFVQPESFTGEDVVELHIHGGAFLAGRLMEVLAGLGARQALAGEFSFRAVRNGKMSVSQAQAVADLIAAPNEGAIRLALEKVSGTQNKLLNELALSLRQLAVLGEAGIDFSDQDIDELSLPRLKDKLHPPITALEGLQASYARGSRLQHGVSAAFVGLPNAGKSSFFNALLGEDRSIVSEIPGTTRDVVREQLTLRSERTTITLRMEDTAGLRSADNLVEQIGIERSQQAARGADLVLWLVDPGSSLSEIREQWNALGAPKDKTLGIFTKCDLHSTAIIEATKTALVDTGIRNWAKTSSQTGAGINEAINEITAFCENWTHRTPGEILITRLDQLACVDAALEHLQRAAVAPEVDLFAADIRQALHSLGPLIGETLPDDILGKIFSEFCIGK